MPAERPIDLSSDGSVPASGPRFRLRLSRRDWMAAALAGSAAFAVYALTAAPTVTAEDSGELAAAAWTLGIAHPPGYPLYMLLAHAFARLFPFGEVAWRLSILSGALGAAAVALAVLLALRLSATRRAAVSAGLVVAFMPALWSQSTIVEVYTLSAVVLLVAVHAAILYLVRPAPSRLWALSYVAGLSLAAHPSLVFLVPGAGAAALLGSRGAVRRFGEVLCAGGFFLLGFSVYLYLPIRSLADPAMDWGDPESFSTFFVHLLRLQYSGLSEPARRPVLDHALYAAYVAAFEVGPLLLGFAVLGWRRMLEFPGGGHWPRDRARARRAFRAAYVLWVVLFSAGFLPVLSVSFGRQTLALNSVFFLPLLLLLVPPGAVGLERFLGAAEVRLGARGRRLGWGLCAALPAAFLAGNFSREDRSSYTVARDYAESILKTIPEGGIYIPSGDHANFPVLYLQIVEGARPDVIVADKYGYLDPAVLRGLAATEDDFRRVARLAREDLERWLIDESGRPAFANAKHAIRDLPPDRFLPVGLLYRIDRGRKPLDPEAEERLWASYAFRSFGGDFPRDFRWAGGPLDVPAEFIWSEILFHRAESLFRRGDRAGALAALERLRVVAASYKELLQNAGSLLVEKGLRREAGPFYEAALALDPDYAVCRRNYAWCLLSGGIELGKAVALAERSLEEMPPELPLLKLLGDAYVKLGRYRNARDAYLVAANLGEGDADAWRLAGEVAERDLKWPSLAKVYYSQSLRLRPTQPEVIEKVHGKAARERYEEAARRALEELTNRYGLEGAVPGISGVDPSRLATGG